MATLSIASKIRISHNRVPGHNALLSVVLHSTLGLDVPDMATCLCLCLSTTLKEIFSRQVKTGHGRILEYLYELSNSGHPPLRRCTTARLLKFRESNKTHKKRFIIFYGDKSRKIGWRTCSTHVERELVLDVDYVRMWIGFK
jgi:hypothetical protein